MHRNNNWKGSIYMVFDYAEHDLTGLMDTVKYKFTEAQVGAMLAWNPWGIEGKPGMSRCEVGTAGACVGPKGQY